MKKFLFPLLCFALIFSFTHKSKREFSFASFYSPLAYDSSWECSPVQSGEDVETLLNQKFHYLGSGAQMVAFEGEDGVTVLKLFKMKRLLPKKWLALAPVTSAYRYRKTTFRKERLKRLFHSIKLAYQRVPVETGVMFAQLNPGFEKKVVVLDKQKEEHCIDLAHTPFVLQKKGELIYSRMLRHLKNGEIAALNQDREKILTLVAQRCRKGIVDSDSGVSANYAFVGESAVQIDIGELSSKELTKGEIDRELQRIQDKMNENLRKH